jgi:hypothetical protein
MLAPPDGKKNAQIRLLEIIFPSLLGRFEIMLSSGQKSHVLHHSPSHPAAHHAILSQNPAMAFYFPAVSPQNPAFFCNFTFIKLI